MYSAIKTLFFPTSNADVQAQTLQLQRIEDRMKIIDTNIANKILERARRVPKQNLPLSPRAVTQAQDSGAAQQVRKKSKTETTMTAPPQSAATQQMVLTKKTTAKIQAPKIKKSVATQYTTHQQIRTYT